MDFYSYNDIERALRSEREDDTVEVRVLRPNEVYTKHTVVTRAALLVGDVTARDEGTEGT